MPGANIEASARTVNKITIISRAMQDDRPAPVFGSLNKTPTNLLSASYGDQMNYSK